MVYQNISNILLDLNDPFELFSIGAKVCISLVLVIFLVTGSVLYTGLISFERLGGDPQKRGLANQLVSIVCGQTVILYMAITPVVVWRYMIGHINVMVFWTWLFTTSSFLFQAFVTIAFSLVFEFLTHVVWKQVLPIVDDVMARFTLLTSVIIGSWLSVINLFCQTNSVLAIKFIGRPLSLALDTPLGFNLIVIVSAVIVSFAIFSKVWFKIEQKRMEDVPIPMDNTINNRSYNKEIATSAVGLVTLILVFAAAMAGNFNEVLDGKVMRMIELLTADLVHPFLIQVFIPILIYIKNPRLRHYVIEAYLQNN